MLTGNYFYFYLKPGEKHAGTVGWQKAASNDPQIIAEAKRINRDLGIACGHRSNLLVEDVDAAGAVERLEAAAGMKLPETHRVNTSIDPETGFQKYQLYWQFPENGSTLENKTKLFGGIDIRTEGGLVVAAGAKLIPNHQYKSCDDLPNAKMPIELLRALEQEQERMRALVNQKSAAKSSGVTDDGKVRKGQRDESMFRWICSLRAKLGRNKQVLLAAARAQNAENYVPPLEDSVVVKKVESSLTYSDAEIRELLSKRSLFLKVKKATSFSNAELEWLFFQIILCGALNLFVGLPDSGKTILTILLIACLTRGRAFPFSKQIPVKGRVLIISAEDSETVWRQRLMMADADLDMVDFLNDLGDKEDDEVNTPWALNQPQHRELLHAYLKEHPEYKLVVLDPLAALVGGVSLNDPTQVREVLDPLNKIAQETGVAMLLIAHSTKALIDSVIKAAAGSIQIMASVAVAFYFFIDEQNQRQVGQARNKAGGLGKIGFHWHIDGRFPDWYTRNEYEPEKDPGVALAVVDKSCEVDVNGYLRRAMEKGASKVERIKAFLRDFLKLGPATRKLCKDALWQAGFREEDVINDACSQLGVIRPRKGGDDALWSLPEQLKSAAEQIREDFGEMPVPEIEGDTSFDFQEEERNVNTSIG